MRGWHDLSEKQPQCRLDLAFYDRVRAGRPTYRLVEKALIPPYSGRGFRVQKGQTFRVIEETGPQVGAIAAWNADETRESIFPAGTWSQEGIYLRVYGRLLSTPPWRRPVMTCIEDTVRTDPPETAYHHHFLGTHCSPEFMEMRFGVAGLNGCRANLVRAIAPLGLKEEDLHDSINVHQKAYLDMKRGKIWVVPSDARAGDYVEFFAEVNLLVGVSVCPLGDGTRNPLQSDDGLGSLRVEIYETGIQPQMWPRWTDWRPTWRGKWSWPDEPVASPAR